MKFWIPIAYSSRFWSESQDTRDLTYFDVPYCFSCVDPTAKLRMLRLKKRMLQIELGCSRYHDVNMEVSVAMGVSQKNGWFTMGKSHLEMDDLGYPYFRKTTICFFFRGKMTLATGAKQSFVQVVPPIC